MPTLIGFARVGKDVVRDARVAHPAIEAHGTCRAIGFGEFAEPVQQLAPMGPRLSSSIQKLVKTIATGDPVAADEVGLEARRVRGHVVHYSNAILIVLPPFN